MKVCQKVKLGAVSLKNILHIWLYELKTENKHNLWHFIYLGFPHNYIWMYDLCLASEYNRNAQPAIHWGMHKLLDIKFRIIIPNWFTISLMMASHTLHSAGYTQCTQCRSSVVNKQNRYLDRGKWTNQVQRRIIQKISSKLNQPHPPPTTRAPLLCWPGCGSQPRETRRTTAWCHRANWNILPKGRTAICLLKQIISWAPFSLYQEQQTYITRLCDTTEPVD